MLIAITLVLAIEVSGFYLLQDRFGKPEGFFSREDDSIEEKMAPIFVSIPPVLANLGNDGSYRQLSVSLDIMTREGSTANLLQDQMPRIRNEVVAMFDQRPLSYVKTVDGKERIRQEALERIRSIVHDEGGDGPTVEGIYYSNLIIE